jgi:hypothetical protein
VGVDRKLAAILVLALILVGGCVNTKFTAVGETFPPYSGPVKVLTDKPGVPFDEIGLISAQGGNALTTADMVAALQREAAAVGGNAVIISPTKESQQAVATYSPMFGMIASQNNIKEILGLAIRIR